MKTKHYFLIAAVGMFTLAAGSAWAFHAGGVAHCDGCHSMHNSPENPVTGTPNGMLLKGSDASSTCLNCHAGNGGYHIASTDGSNVNEGGDFFWLTQTYEINMHGSTHYFAGDNAGHNIVAADFGLTADATNAQAPGGTYSANLLGCTSCHDAHGQVQDGTKGGSAPVSVSGSYGATPVTGTIAGNYRLLGDDMYEAGNHTSDGFAFSNTAPIAISHNSYSTSYGDKSRYGQGMSEWCANCHGGYLNQATKHPAGAGNGILNGYGTNYNSYVATGNFTGSSATAYLDLVPFELGTSVTDNTGMNVSSTAGPAAGAQVMCLTCHRAHASAFNNSARWDFETEFLAESWVDDATVAPAVPATAKAYYADGVAVDIHTDFGEFQRSLCNKCHVQD